MSLLPPQIEILLDGQPLKYLAKNAIIYNKKFIFSSPLCASEGGSIVLTESKFIYFDNKSYRVYYDDTLDKFQLSQKFSIFGLGGPAGVTLTSAIDYQGQAHKVLFETGRPIGGKETPLDLANNAYTFNEAFTLLRQEYVSKKRQLPGYDQA